MKIYACIPAAVLLFAMALSQVQAQDFADAQTTPPVIHQTGIIRVNPAQDSSAKTALTPIPEFVHHQTDAMTKPDTASSLLVDWSAIYINPPLMTSASMTMTVAQQFPGGRIMGWYPYAAMTTSDSVTWKNLQIGVPADGLETTHPQWMTARQVEKAATIFLEKPVPAGLHKGDVGTTEGDVFLFARGNLAGVPPLACHCRLQRGISSGTENMISIKATADLKPWPESLAWSWIVLPQKSGSLQYRRIPIPSPGAETTTLTAILPAGSRPGISLSNDLRDEIIETLAGNRLNADEALATSRLVIEIAEHSDTPLLIYPAPESWIAEKMPITIKGNAKVASRLFLLVEPVCKAD